jgi:ATP-dependent DNA helicase RecG
VGVTPGQVSAVAAHVKMGTYALPTPEAPKKDVAPAALERTTNLLRQLQQLEAPRGDSSRVGPILLGADAESGEDVNWNPDPGGGATNPHVLILGESGTGKTYAIAWLTAELAQQGVVSVVFDYGQGFSRRTLPREFVAATRPLELHAGRDGLDMNPLQIFPSDLHGPLNVAQRVTGTFARVDPLVAGAAARAGMKPHQGATPRSGNTVTSAPGGSSNPRPRFSGRCTMTADAAKIAQLEEWMKGKEGANLEFKEAKANFHFETLTKYCCALANEGGGRMVLGVTDKRPRKVVGTTVYDQPERTRKGLCDRLPLSIDFEEIHHPDGRVLVFQVPARPLGTPIKYDGVYWMRKEDSLVAMSEDRLRAIFAESGHDFSGDFCSGLRFEDLDPAAVEEFRRRWIEKARKGENAALAMRLAAMTPREVLNDAEAVIDGQVTYAALILFGTAKALGRHLAQAEVVFEYRSTDASGPAQDRQEYRRAFFTFYDELWARINLRNEQQDFQDGFFVTPIATFNERPVREAVLNAVSHRDYQLGGSIFVRQFPRRLEIDSPGGLPFGITLDNILDRQNPRNRLIAQIFTRCGLVERSGQGMNLIFEEAIRQSKATPDFSRTDQYQVGLTLFGTVEDPAFVRFVEKVGRETTAPFSTHDWLVLAAVARDEKVPKALKGRVQRLLDLGLIERVAGRRCMLSRKYYEFVGRKAAYTRKKGLDREQNLGLLLKHIADNAATGSKLEDLCQVLSALPATHVQSLLRTLKRRGTAHSVGSTSAGRWYPGPTPGTTAKKSGDTRRRKMT